MVASGTIAVARPSRRHHALGDRARDAQRDVADPEHVREIHGTDGSRIARRAHGEDHMRSLVVIAEQHADPPLDRVERLGAHGLATRPYRDRRSRRDRSQIDRRSK
jgi:hypothetical protein